MGSRGPSLYPVVASSVLVLAGGMMKNCAVILSVFFTLCLGSIQGRSTADMLRSLISELSKKSDTCMCPPAFREEGSPPEGGPEFTCADGETTIPAHWVNDKEDDCGDCSDETACTECSTWADGYDPTCWDYSSEERALAKKEDTCECPDFDADVVNSASYDMENYAKFTCANGKEISADYKNDAWDDCGDCSDEPACSACVSSGDELEPWIDDCWFEGMDSYYYDAADLEAAHNDEHGEVEQAAAETPGTSKRQEPQQGGHGKRQEPQQGGHVKRQEPQQGGHGKRHVLRKLAMVMKKGV